MNKSNNSKTDNNKKLLALGLTALALLLIPRHSSRQNVSIMHPQNNNLRVKDEKNGVKTNIDL